MQPNLDDHVDLAAQLHHGPAAAVVAPDLGEAREAVLDVQEHLRFLHRGGRGGRQVRVGGALHDVLGRQRLVGDRTREEPAQQVGQLGRVHRQVVGALQQQVKA